MSCELKGVRIEGRWPVERLFLVTHVRKNMKLWLIMTLEMGKKGKFLRDFRSRYTLILSTYSGTLNGKSLRTRYSAG